MLKIGLLAMSAMLMMDNGAIASEKPSALRRVSCSLVRFYVAKYSETAAETWARSHGATDAEIETARRCLTGSSLRTARAWRRTDCLRTTWAPFQF